MKPKKGVMPPALKKYWASRRHKKERSYLRSKSKEDAGVMRRVQSANEKLKRRMATWKTNPKRGRLMFRFEIQKGASKLFLRRDHKTFAKTGPFALFATASHMQSVANSLARKFPTLQGWKFYATPTHTYV